MAEEERVLALALGTFHAALLMVLLVALLQAFGLLSGFLGAVGTLPGVALFLWLWVIAVFSARRVLRDVDVLHGNAPVMRVVERAMLFGGLGGAAFVLAFAALQSARFGVTGLLFFATFGVLGGVLVGAVFGAALVVLDGALLLVADRVRASA